MKRVATVCRRELAGYFRSWSGYALMAVFLLLAGHFFYTDLIFFILYGGADLPLGLWRFVFLDLRMVTMLVLPLVTMRLFAEERKLGTIELLHTYPVRDGEILAGKFLGAWLFFLIMVLPTLLGPAILYQMHPYDPAPLVASYLGLILLGTAFIACGLFVSTLTESQVIAAMLTYGVLVFFWFMTWNEEAGGQTLMRLLLGISLFDRYYNFTRGVIDTRDVAYFVLLTGLFLFFALQSLASRAWRGLR